jgi:hypothetical protein
VSDEAYLPNERGIVAVPEIYGQHIFSELFDLLDNKAFPTPRPTNNIAVFFILNKGENTSNI